MKRLSAFVVLVCMASVALPAEERVDLDVVTQIRLEEFKNSKVMETASELMDRIGPRLTGSPQMKEANEWTKTKLAEWGLSNAHLETWGPFGRGWQYQACAVRMITPDHAELLALPQAWTPGTNGPVRASVLRLNIKSKDELEKLKGKFAGKIVLYGDVREVKPHDKPDLSRYDEKSLAEVATYELPGGPPRYDRAEYMKRAELRRAAEAFLADEKPLAVIDLGRGDFGTFGIQGGGEYKKSKPMSTTPWLSMESEHFGRIARLLDRDVPVELELDVKATFIDEDQMQWNTIAEIPGTDKKDEVVMVGAHLDSWQRRHRRDGQRRRLRRRDGSHADPEGPEREAAPHDPHRALDGRGAGALRLARLRRSALRVAAADDPGREGQALVPPEGEVAADRQARAREARGLLQSRQRHAARSAASTRRTTRPSSRSSRRGSRRSTTSARRPSR